MFTPSAELIHSTPDALKLIEICGRTAYGSPEGATKADTDRWIRARVRGWELDVLEHASTTWRIVCSRVAAQQFTRHRIAAYTMQSMRFREPQPSDMVLLPPECKPEDASEWLADYRAAYALYTKWRDRGYPKQAARFHLPLGSATVLVATWNFRQLRHIFEMRCGAKAEPEIRELATSMYRTCLEKWPPVFEGLRFV